RLFVDYGAEGRLSLAEYEKIGGVQGSIEAAITRALADPSHQPTIPASKEEQFSVLRAAFIPWLARIDPESGAAMRRVAEITEIPDRARGIVARLIEARLLLSERRSGRDVVEIAHESLLRQWPALVAWLQADAEDLQVADGIERSAAEWTRNEQNEAW